MAFRMFDKNRDGYVDAKELKNVTATLGEALSQAEIDDFMREADVDGDGRLNYDEFVKMMLQTD